MHRGLLADKYSKALVACAAQVNALEQLDAELDRFARLLEKQTALRQILLSPIISLRQKKELLRAVFKEQRPSPLLTGFLELLLEKRRFNLFPEINRSYKELIYSRRRKMKVTAESRFALDARQKEMIRDKLAKIYQKKIDLSVRENPALLGGLRVCVGHKVYDGSLKKQLALIRDEIWKQ